VSTFISVVALAVIVGVCHYLSRVRPVFKAAQRSLQELRELEAWWALESSEVVLAASDEDSDVDTVA
jgi:hypothetical protein